MIFDYINLNIICFYINAYNSVTNGNLKNYHISR